MRFVIVNDAYDQFLGSLYQDNAALRSMTFEKQREQYYRTGFGVSDAYVRSLEALGHEVQEVVYNALPMQQAWWRDHCRKRAPHDKATAIEESYGANESHVAWLQKVRRNLSATPLRYLKPIARPLLNKIDAVPKFLFEVFLTQLKQWEPDVILNQSVFRFTNEQIRELKRHTGLLVGEHAATALPSDIDYTLYDLLVSSFPPTIEFWRSRNARAELVRLAFDPRVLEDLPARERDLPLTFAGSLFKIHSSRLALLESVAREFDELQVYGELRLHVPSASPLLRKTRPAVWGRDMYALLGRSRITLNHHGDVLPFANNMRLYEATGMGCLLITDWKQNLGEMFEPEKEVVTYRDPEECVDKIRYYLDARNDSARCAIAEAGHRRTMKEHSYAARMMQLCDLLN